jgi:hypothetical protein
MMLIQEKFCPLCDARHQLLAYLVKMLRNSPVKFIFSGIIATDSFSGDQVKLCGERRIPQEARFHEIETDASSPSPPA